MTQGMGISRAFSSLHGGRDGGAWDRVTHVGSNSGGNWFSSQFFYSEEFYASLIDTDVSLSDFVAEWGSDYETRMVEAVESGAAWATNISTGSFFLEPICNGLATLLDMLPPILDARAFPAWNWLPYIASMLEPWIVDLKTATYGTRSMTGLRTATLIQQISLPPTAFLDSSLETMRVVTYVDGFVPNATSDAYVVPMSHVQPPNCLNSASCNGSWLLSANIANITARTEASFRAQTLDLLAPRDPLIIEIVSASSSAAGIAASPVMMSEYANGTLAQRILDCMPLGLETLATPMLVNGTTLPTDTDVLFLGTDEEIMFRSLDGAYTDNSNAAMTLARMQAECAAGDTGLDCSDGYYRMIISGDSVQDSIFFDPVYPPGSMLPVSEGGNYGPVPTIFSELPPSSAELLPYATADIYRNGSYATSYYWHGWLTTVQNDWYGVQGGDVVELLYFLGCETLMDIGGKNASFLFEKFYAPSAVSQAVGAVPILDAFINGTLE